ncbi:MAG: exodeoxyribonuclease VII small subunit [Bacteroidaceae bacterium]|nr:exodeoxyribonuclease VII small subunit [Bacteroidaceae bacterium]
MTTMTYTEAIDRLNEIMQQMESGELDVDALTETLKEARQLLAFCKEKLHTIEQDVQQIMTATQGEE